MSSCRQYRFECAEKRDSEAAATTESDSSPSEPQEQSTGDFEGEEARASDTCVTWEIPTRTEDWNE